MSLDIPFYRTFPSTRLTKQIGVKCEETREQK